MYKLFEDMCKYNLNIGINQLNLDITSFEKHLESSLDHTPN